MILRNDGASETQYLDMVREARDRGHLRMDRTGVGTRALHGRTMRFDLSDGTIPLLTTKFVPFSPIVHEQVWFLSGSSNIRPLLLNKTRIWSEWPHKKYVEATGDAIDVRAFEQRVLESEDFAAQWGDLGPVYGVQWRRWQGPDGRVYDQISDLLERLRRDPYSRRLLFHGWNVADVDQMALPPCHLLYQFFVADNRLSLTLYQRSCDLGLGVPFNIASAALLVRMIAAQVGMEPGELFWVGHDVHLYTNHIPLLEPQLSRTPRPFPQLEILRKPESLFEYVRQDFKIVGYDPHPKIDLPVAV